jgi:non-ribosomal peptide synthetase component F
MADRFQVLLESLVSNPDDPISTVPFLTADERQQLDGFNATTAPIPDVCVHQLVDEQADRTPDAHAVGGLSYRNLVHLANGLSHGLILRGVKPDTLVGVSLPHGPELVAAILGIWKAGAAYLPLDPDDPPARREQILADAGPVPVLTCADRFPPLKQDRRSSPMIPNGSPTRSTLLVRQANRKLSWPSIAASSTSCAGLPRHSLNRCRGSPGSISMPRSSRCSHP